MAIIEAPVSIEVRIPAIIGVIGPHVPEGVATTAVRLSLESVTVEAASVLPSQAEVALAFVLPLRHRPRIVATAIVERSSALAQDLGRMELRFRQLIRQDFEDVASFLVQQQLRHGV